MVDIGKQSFQYAIDVFTIHYLHKLKKFIFVFENRLTSMALKPVAGRLGSVVNCCFHMQSMLIFALLSMCVAVRIHIINQEWISHKFLLIRIQILHRRKYATK